MDPATIIFGVGAWIAVLLTFAHVRVRREMRPHNEGELETLISTNIRAWADREREANRIEKTFQKLT